MFIDLRPPEVSMMSKEERRKRIIELATRYYELVRRRFEEIMESGEIRIKLRDVVI